MSKKTALTTNKKLSSSSSRRGFLQGAAVATGGLAGILATGIAPATAQLPDGAIASQAGGGGGGA